MVQNVTDWEDVDLSYSWMTPDLIPSSLVLFFWISLWTIEHALEKLALLNIFLAPKLSQEAALVQLFARGKNLKYVKAKPCNWYFIAWKYLNVQLPFLLWVHQFAHTYAMWGESVAKQQAHCKANQPPFEIRNLDLHTGTCRLIQHCCFLNEKQCSKLMIILPLSDR